MGTVVRLAALAVALGAALSAADAARGSAPSAASAFPAEPGPALRLAVEAMEGGDAERADAVLAAVARRHPIVADHARLLRMDLAVSRGRLDEAIELRRVWSHLDSPLTSEFHSLLGDAYAARGDEVAARNAWEFAVQQADDDEREAALRVRIARSWDRVGEPERAGPVWLRVWTEHPTRPEAEIAAAHLDLLEAGRSESLRTGDAWRRRGDVLYRERHNEAALAAYEAALTAPLSGAARRHVARRRAYTLFRLRRYPEAATAFAALPGSEEFQIQHARSLARSGEVERAARALEKLAGGATRGNAARARLIAALLWEGEGEEERARGLFERVARDAAGTESADTALWRLGWAAYRAERYDDATALFARLAPRAEDPIEALQVRYWGVRAREKQGDPEAAALFAELAGEFPLTYYGWRAGYRAEGRPLLARPEPLPEGISVLSPRELARPAVLLEAGLRERVRGELDRLFPRARGLRDRLDLAALYARSGDHHRAQRLVVDAYRLSLARGPVDAQIAAWHHAWPRPFLEEVRRASEGDGVDPALVYAVMREESGYRPEVISVSGARGLLQLMPSTAEVVAADTGLEGISPAALFVPDVNIRLGTRYLSQLRRRFDGHPSAAIGSYNAGPHRVERWLAARGDDDDDEWVEAIPYAQTRAYVKRVLRSVHAYRVLY